MFDMEVLCFIVKLYLITKAFPVDFICPTNTIELYASLVA